MNFLQHSLFVSPGYARWWTGATNGHLNQWQTPQGSHWGHRGPQKHVLNRRR